MHKVLLVVVVSACSIEPGLSSTSQSLVESSPSNSSVTKIRVNGLSAFALLHDSTTGTNGFLTASKDQITDTSALDFAYATPSTTDPNVIILTQGAGEIPNSSFAVTADSATLDVVGFPTTRCEVNQETGDFACAAGDPISLDLTWTADGFMRIHEKCHRTEVFGPVTTKIVGEFDQRSALVDGTWNGHSGTNMNGELFDTQSRSVMREIEMRMAP